MPADLARAANDVVGHLEKLVPGPEIEERPQAEGVEEEHRVYHASALGQVPPGSDRLERDGRSVVRPLDLGTDEQREGAVLRAPARLGDLERLGEVIEPVPVARERPRRPR